MGFPLQITPGRQLSLPPSWPGWSRERVARCEAAFIYLLLLGISLRALDRSLEGFIPLLDLVDGGLAGLRQGTGRWFRGAAGRARPSVHASTHWTNSAKSVLGAMHTLADLGEEELLPSDYRCENRGSGI